MLWPKNPHTKPHPIWEGRGGGGGGEGFIAAGSYLHDRIFRLKAQWQSASPCVKVKLNRKKMGGGGGGGRMKEQPKTRDDDDDYTDLSDDLSDDLSENLSLCLSFCFSDAFSFLEEKKFFLKIEEDFFCETGGEGSSLSASGMFCRR